jgi:hypothetical protein
MEYLPQKLLQGDTTGRVRPSVVKFDTQNEMHMMYLRAAVRLQAEVHGISFDLDESQLPEMIGRCRVEQEEFEVVDPQKLKSQFDGMTFESEVLPIKFDKDNDVHMDFVFGYARSRAAQVGIPMDNHGRLEVMRIVGDIAPSLATTTAMVGGAAFSELPLLFSSEVPMSGILSLSGLRYDKLRSRAPCTRKMPDGKMRYSVWEVVDVDGNEMFQDVNSRLEKQFGVEISAWVSDRMDFLDVYGCTGSVTEELEKVFGYRDDFYLAWLCVDEVSLPAVRVRNHWVD